MRTIDLIDIDINRCKAQIAATFDNHNASNGEATQITREGFQQQLVNLNTERDLALKQITVINPTLVSKDAVFLGV